MYRIKVLLVAVEVVETSVVVFGVVEDVASIVVVVC